MGCSRPIRYVASIRRTTCMHCKYVLVSAVTRGKREVLQDALRLVTSSKKDLWRGSFPLRRRRSGGRSGRREPHSAMQHSRQSKLNSLQLEERWSRTTTGNLPIGSGLCRLELGVMDTWIPTSTYSRCRAGVGCTALVAEVRIAQCHNSLPFPSLCARACVRPSSGVTCSCRVRYNNTAMVERLE